MLRAAEKRTGGVGDPHRTCEYSDGRFRCTLLQKKWEVSQTRLRSARAGACSGTAQPAPLTAAVRAARRSSRGLRAPPLPARAAGASWPALPGPLFGTQPAGSAQRGAREGMARCRLIQFTIF